MIKFRSAATLAAFATATFATAAFAEDTQRFVHDGRIYTYTTSTNADGQTVLKGKSAPGGSFELVVADNAVSGYANGSQVEFTLKSARGAAKGARPATIAVAKADGAMAVAGTNN